MAKSKRSMLFDAGYATRRKPPSTPPSAATGSTRSTHSRRASSSSSSGPASPANGGRTRGSIPAPAACAACKHQRRKCTARCVLVPYFPSDRPKRFRNALRLFGVKDILRLLEEAGPEKRDDCMRSIIYESDALADHPVHGYRSIVRSLDNEFNREATELAAVRQRLASCRRTRCLQPPAPPRQRTALPLATTPYVTKAYEDQVHARKKTMSDIGDARMKTMTTR